MIRVSVPPLLSSGRHALVLRHPEGLTRKTRGQATLKTDELRRWLESQLPIGCRLEKGPMVMTAVCTQLAGVFVPTPEDPVVIWAILEQG